MFQNSTRWRLPSSDQSSSAAAAWSKTTRICRAGQKRRRVIKSFRKQWAKYQNHHCLPLPKMVTLNLPSHQKISSMRRSIRMTLHSWIDLRATSEARNSSSQHQMRSRPYRRGIRKSIMMEFRINNNLRLFQPKSVHRAQVGNSHWCRWTCSTVLKSETPSVMRNRCRSGSSSKSARNRNPSLAPPKTHWAITHPKEASISDQLFSATTR